MTPKRFRLKRSEFSAVQFDGSNGEEIAAWVEAGPGFGFVRVAKLATGDPPHLIVYINNSNHTPVWVGGWVFLYGDGSVEAFAGNDPATLYDPVDA